MGRAESGRNLGATLHFCFGPSELSCFPQQVTDRGSLIARQIRRGASHWRFKLLFTLLYKYNKAFPQAPRPEVRRNRWKSFNVRAEETLWVQVVRFCVLKWTLSFSHARHLILKTQSLHLCKELIGLSACRDPISLLEMSARHLHLQWHRCN